MIEVFKILHNYYDSEVAPKLTLNNASVTRGNSLKLLNQSFHYDFRKYSFTARVVNLTPHILQHIYTTGPRLTVSPKMDRCLVSIVRINRCTRLSFISYHNNQTAPN